MKLKACFPNWRVYQVDPSKRTFSSFKDDEVSKARPDQGLETFLKY